MSDPSDGPAGLDKYAPYAPKRIRDAVEPGQSTSVKRFDKLHRDRLSQSQPLVKAADENMAVEGFRSPQRFTPTRVGKSAIDSIPPPPPPGVGNTRSSARFLTVSAGLLLVCGGAFSALWASGAISNGEGWGSFGLNPNGRINAEQPSRNLAKLSVAPTTPRRIGELLPLGVSVHDLSDGGLIVVKGLASGMKLSAGSPAGDNNWWLSAKDLDDVLIEPPAGFVGAIDVAVELRLADTTLSDYRTLHFEWVAAAALEAKSTVATEPQVKRQASHRITPEDVDALLKRGERLIASGDFAAARLVLQRAAEGGNARAALMLAGTYDPVMLEKVQAIGCSPDIPLARYWYEKANELGSPDAPQRLKLLAIRRE
jgi:hypothetical protein